MQKANLDEVVIKSNFTKLDEACLMAITGGCSGCGSITEGISFRMPIKGGGWVHW